MLVTWCACTHTSCCPSWTTSVGRTVGLSPVVGRGVGGVWLVGVAWEGLVWLVRNMGGVCLVCGNWKGVSSG